jgi:hypothetical protein
LAKDSAVQLDDEERSRIITSLAGNIEQSESAMLEYLADVTTARNYYKYRLPDDKANFPKGSMARIMFVKETQLALMADIVPALLNIIPIMHVESVIKTQAEVADVMELFYQKILRHRMDFHLKFKAFINAGLRDGSVVMMTTWRKTEGWRWLYDAKGNPDQEISTVYDYPDCEVIPIDKFFAWPVTGVNLQRCGGCGVIRTISGDDLQQGVNEKRYDDEAVERLLTGSWSLDADAQTPNDEIYDVTPSNAHTLDKKEEAQQVFQLHHAFMKYQHPGQEIAQEWEFLYHSASNSVIRAKPFGYWHGKRPFVSYTPYSADEGIIGDSITTTGGGQTEESMTKALRGAHDALILGLNPRKFIPVSLYEELERMYGPKALDRYSEAGANIPLPDQFFQSDGKIIPIMPGYHPNEAIALMEYSDQSGQKATGGDDASKMGVSNGDITATQSQIMMEASKKRTGMITENAAIAGGEIMEQIHGLTIQHCGHESIKSIWDAVQTEGQEIPIEQAMIQPYEFAMNGMTETSNRMIISQNAIQKYAVAKDWPDVQQDPKLAYTLKYKTLRDGFNDTSPEDIIGTKEEAVARAQQMQQQQAALQQQMMEAQAQKNQPAQPAQPDPMEQQLTAQVGEQKIAQEEHKTDREQLKNQEMIFDMKLKADMHDAKLATMQEKAKGTTQGEDKEGRKS